jgi:electron transport complex protein RnfA
MVIATAVTYLLQMYVLEPYNVTFLQTIVFILVIAALVQVLEIVMKKAMPSLYQALGVFLPLITTNCAVLGVAILVVQKNMTMVEALVYSMSTAVGFTLALVIFAGIREQLSISRVPKCMQGVPIALITAGILAMAFMGFAGIKIG